MDKWDEEKLRTVVLSKGGNPRTTTDVCNVHLNPCSPHKPVFCQIVCKFFIQAIETEKSVNRLYLQRLL